MAKLNSKESNESTGIRQVTDLSQQFQHVFSNFQSFNIIQSQLMDQILFTDSPVVVSAPTGSGKTVLFEFAIIRLLEKCQREEDSPLINKKILYLAPIKALCTERFNDWECKFRKLGLKAIEVTGDSDEGNLLAIQHFNLVLTTPEKWDSLTRKWRDHATLVEVIKLILIDEVHLLNEEKRGSTLEAVVSRMKTIQDSSMRNDYHIRFLAVSATIPNIEDVAAWLGKKNEPAKYYKFGDEMRPVHLNKVVKTYPFKESMSYFKFDLNLSYKLKQIILDYSEGKPTLIFCSTRKAVLQTSSILLQNITFHFTPIQKMTLEEALGSIVDSKLKDMIKYGVAFHHAGLSPSDRHNIEELFKSGFLPILVSTSTLAMGVNLPAHLVIIKSTAQYVNGSWEEYTEGQILQMMGRAGRPQFDSSATAVILTKDAFKEKYEKLVSGNDIVESNLHKNLAEHLNSEIVLGTITDIAVSVHWLRSTFFYIRALKNPRRYGIPDGLPSAELEARLQAMCMRELNGLEKYELIKKTDFAYNVEPTENGKLMARLYIAFETMKLFMKVKGTETLSQVLNVICQCHEFSDVQLRVNEKTTLNLLNKNKTNEAIRFPLDGRIKTKEMKINCLIQATLGGIQIQDISLAQECKKILRTAERLIIALSLYLWQRSWYEGLASALILAKSIKSRMWENSCYISRQLPGIGPALASRLVTARKTTFKSIIESNPRDLERIINKHPPMGNSIQEAAKSIPQYSLELNYREVSKKLYICLKLINFDIIIDSSHTFSLLIAGCNNELLRKEKIRDGILIEQRGEINITVNIPPEMNIEAIIVHLISDTLVGVDLKKVVAVFSKYQFFSQEEAENFCSDQESLESSELSYEEKPLSVAIQKKNIKKLPKKEPRSLNQTIAKEKSNKGSKLQTNLSQYAFKSIKRQFKHVKNDINNSDNEVSSTQDYILNNNPHPSPDCLKKGKEIENKISKNITVEPDNFNLEKRMKIDMEYKWYIQKNIEISTETDQNEIITKSIPNINVFKNPMIQSKTYKNSYSHSSKPETVHYPESKTNTSKSNISTLETHVSGLQKHQVHSSLKQTKNLNKPPTINLQRKNNSNSHNITPEMHNFKTAPYRNPIQLSPRQFFKYGKDALHKTNSSNFAKRTLYPLFIPLCNKSNKFKDVTEDEKTTESIVSNVIEAVSLNCDILNSQSNIPKERILFCKENNEKQMKNKKDYIQCDIETKDLNENGTEMLKKKNPEEIKYFHKTTYDSVDGFNDNELILKTYTQTPEIYGLISDIKNNSQENKDTSYSQLDDLFLDLPEINEKSSNTMDIPLTNESNKEATRNTQSVPIEQKQEVTNKKSSYSLTYNIPDFSKKLLNLEACSNMEELSMDEVESYNDHSDNDSSSEHKLLRIDYGDPFAPVHDSVTLQKLVGKSKKENLSFDTIQRNFEFLQHSEPSEYICTDNIVSHSDVISRQKSSTNNFETLHDNQMYENNPPQRASPKNIQILVPDCSQIPKKKLNSHSVKCFSPFHKEVSSKQHCNNNIFGGRNEINEQNRLQSEIPASQKTCHQNYIDTPNHLQSFHRRSMFNNHLPPKEIELFKKNMFLNPIFSQKKKILKKEKSDYSEECLPRLSNLLYNKRSSFDRSSTYSFQSASNLKNPMATAVFLPPQELHNCYQYETKTYMNKEHVCNQDHVAVNSKPNLSTKHESIANSSFNHMNMSPLVMQQSYPAVKNKNCHNYTFQENCCLKSIIEQQKPIQNISPGQCYEINNPITPSRRDIETNQTWSQQSSYLNSQLFQPVSLNDANLSPPALDDEIVMIEDLNQESFPYETISPSLNESLDEDSSSSAFSGEYLQAALASSSAGTSSTTCGYQTPPTNKFN